MRFAFLSEGKLFVKDGAAEPRQIESGFAAERAEHAERRRQRHAWKGAGRDPQDAFNARAVWGRQVADADEDDSAPVFRHIAAGAPGELLYVLQMSASSGLFRHRLDTGEEARVFHRQEFFCNGLSFDPANDEIVYSAGQRGSLANLERLASERSHNRGLTDGEAADSHPSHDPRKPGAIIFQSAGAGRDGQGNLVAFGPAAVLRLDPEMGELETLIESDDHDHLGPRVDGRGNLWFVRRPYRDFARPGLWAQIKGVVMMPVVICQAVFGFADMFARIFARKSLRPAGGPEQKRPEKNRWTHIHDTTVELDKCLRLHAKGDDSAALVPASWELIRRAPDGSEEVIAAKIACFTLGPDDAALYTNGFTVWHLPPGATAPHVVHRGKIIQALAIV